MPGDLVLERLDLAHDALGCGVEDLALLGEMQRPRRALQQPDAEAGFQPGDKLADRRWRQPEPGRGSGKALEINDPHEGGHLARMIDHCGISEWQAAVIVKLLVLFRSAPGIRISLFLGGSHAPDPLSRPAGRPSAPYRPRASHARGGRGDPDPRFGPLDFRRRPLKRADDGDLRAIRTLQQTGTR